MKGWLFALAGLACIASGCGESARPAPTATPRPTATATAIPTPRPRATPRSGPARPSPTPAPFKLWSQIRIAPGEYQLLNNVTYQYVSATAGRMRTICRGGACTTYIRLDTVEYSGNAQVTVGPGQFRLVGRGGRRYAPVTARQAAPVAPADKLLVRTPLVPDDDGDFVSGAIVFLVRPGAGRVDLRWQGLHVATFVVNAHGRLQETR